MENASKALLIAASILIAIILIAFAVKTINSTSGTQESLEQTMTAAEVTMFNNKFTKYLGDNKSPAEARALVNEVIAYNASVDFDKNKSIRVQISKANSIKYNSHLAKGMVDNVVNITKNVTINLGYSTDAYTFRPDGTIKKIYIYEP